MEDTCTAPPQPGCHVRRSSTLQPLHLMSCASETLWALELAGWPWSRTYLPVLVPTKFQLCICQSLKLTPGSTRAGPLTSLLPWCLACGESPAGFYVTHEC